MAVQKGPVMQCGLRVCSLVGSLAPGLRPLEGKSFYLDEVKSRPSGAITEVVGRLGGKVESFLHKDVSVVVTGNREALTGRHLDRSPAAPGQVKDEAAGSPRLQRERISSAQRPVTPRPPVCGSRGKALLEKAIRNNEKSQGSVLTNARSWGVTIVGVDDFLKFLDQLTVELSSHKSKRIEKKAGESSALRVVKAGALKAEFLKVEDSSRRYRPLHAQSLSFPMLSYTGRFSPFEPPAPPRPGKRKGGELSKDKLGKSEEPISSYEKLSAPLLQTPSPRRPRKKSLGYCECCQISYKDQDEHLQSDVHRRFVKDINNYAVVDRLVAGMDAGFSCRPEEQEDKLLMRLSSCSPAPGSPSGQLEQLTKSETERACQAIRNQGSDQLVDILNAKQALEPICDALFEVGEPVMDVPPKTSFESKTVDENVNTHLLLQPRPETPIPSPDPEDIPCAIPDGEQLSRIPSPVPCSPHSVGLDDHMAGTSKDLAEVDHACPGPGPSLDKNGGSTACSNRPQQQLSEDHGGKAALDEQGGTLTMEEDVELPSNTSMTKKSLVDVPPCSVSSCCFLNPRKRSRSFTCSPRRSKKMRTSWCSGQWSDPTYKISAVSGTYGDAPVIHSGLPSMAETQETGVPKAIEHQTCNQNLLCDPPLTMPILQCAHTDMAVREDPRLLSQQDQQSYCGTRDERVTELYPDRAPELESHAAAAAAGIPNDASSEWGPPQLYPFYHFDDLLLQQPAFPYPPKLVPAIPFPFPSEKPAHPPASQASSTSLLSQSFSSVCIESALIPDFTFSPVSSESDWDSGLLSRLAPPAQLQPRGGHCELDLGMLLQRSCAGAQDGSYASQLCSVLQPGIASSAGFGDAVNLNTLYRPIETVDRRIIQSLGV